MTDKHRLYVVSIGMITPVGVDTETTAAAVKAGVSSYKESDFFDDNFNRIKMSCVPQELLHDCLVEDVIVSELQPRHARMLQLAKLAIAQIVEQIPKNNTIPLILAGPESTGPDDQQLTNIFLQNLSIQSGIDLDLVNSRVISLGRAGGLDAIDLAMRYLAVADKDYVLVGAVDTFHEKNVMDYFLAKGRLCANDAMDGFVPGEGAAFLLLSNKRKLNSDGASPFVLEPGLDQEKGHLYSDEIYTGSGLAKAFAKAVSKSSIKNINAIYSSMNGEHYFAKELGVALMRNTLLHNSNSELLHPADCYGDLGAAAGIVMIGLSCMALQKERGPSSFLVYASSDGASRSAAIVSK